jgi:hypothetical protein
MFPIVMALLTQGPPPGPACELLVTADASEVFGMAMKHTVDSEGSVCAVEAVTRTTQSALATARLQMSAGSRMFDGVAALPGNQAVAGVGDKGLWHPMGKTGQLAFMKGARSVVLTVSSVTPDSKTAAEALAKKILARMPH